MDARRGSSQRRVETSLPLIRTAIPGPETTSKVRDRSALATVLHDTRLGEAKAYLRSELGLLQDINNAKSIFELVCRARWQHDSLSMKELFAYLENNGVFPANLPNVDNVRYALRRAKNEQDQRLKRAEETQLFGLEHTSVAERAPSSSSSSGSLPHIRRFGNPVGKPPLVSERGKEIFADRAKFSSLTSDYVTSGNINDRVIIDSCRSEAGCPELSFSHCASTRMSDHKFSGALRPRFGGGAVDCE
jgi:hypothetical protein